MPRTSQRRVNGSTAAQPRAEPRAKASLRIVLADDHPVVRFGLRALLDAQPGLEVVGEASSCAECMALVAEHSPDVVVLDLEMGDCDGADAVARIGAIPGGRVVVYTSHDSEHSVASALEAGAHGFVCKGAAAPYLIDAIRAAARGEVFLDPAVTSKVVGRLGRTNERRRVDRRLTERELDVLRRAAVGERNKEISRALGISERTVKFHMSALLGKLGASNRTEAVRIGMQKGLCGESAGGAASAPRTRGAAHRRGRDRAPCAPAE